MDFHCGAAYNFTYKSQLKEILQNLNEKLNYNPLMWALQYVVEFLPQLVSTDGPGATAYETGVFTSKTGSAFNIFHLNEAFRLTTCISF